MLAKLKNSLINKLILLNIISWIILAVIFGFLDLEISKAVVDEESLWGKFGNDFGEAPGYGLIAIALSILIGSSNNEIKKQKLSAYVIILIGIILFILGFVLNERILIIDGVGIFFPLTLFVIFSYRKDWKNYQKISIVIVLLAIINPLIFVQITKILTGRVRFEDLTANYSDYTPWFMPPGPTGNDSFPSGHTAVAFMFLPLLILIKNYNWKDLKKIIILIFIIGWGFFVGFSRVIVGDHYASDVLFSAEVAFLTTLLLYKKCYQN
jgi:membrane-associated phospholipid phosphatase